MLFTIFQIADICPQVWEPVKVEKVGFIPYQISSIIYFYQLSGYIVNNYCNSENILKYSTWYHPYLIKSQTLVLP